MAIGAAVISECGLYRYRLEREFLFGSACIAWIMVNPSTADHEADDQTIRKVIGFSRALGAGRLIVGNVFAYRSTDVRQLGAVADPFGPDNEEHLRAIMAEADEIIVGWGPVAKLPKQLRTGFQRVVRIASEGGHVLNCLGTAKDGHPRHPLMLAYATALRPWSLP